MMGVVTSAKTDEMRRLAMQLAIQLPESVEDAHKVLNLTREFLDQFLIERTKSPFHARAALLGWNLNLGVGKQTPLIDSGEILLVESTPRRPSLLLALLLGLSTLFVSVPAGMGLIAALGSGSYLTFLLAISCVGLILGQPAALALATATPFIHNLLIVPPAFEFTAPGREEFMCAGFYLATALITPWLAMRAPRIRRYAARFRIRLAPGAGGLRKAG